jgi:hypothetical protein
MTKKVEVEDTMSITQQTEEREGDVLVEREA